MPGGIPVPPCKDSGVGSSEASQVGVDGCPCGWGLIGGIYPYDVDRMALGHRFQVCHVACQLSGEGLGSEVYCIPFVGQDEDPCLTLLRGVTALVQYVVWEVSSDGMDQPVVSREFGLRKEQYVWFGRLSEPADLCCPKWFSPLYS